MSTVPAPTNLRISKHAAERYIERVKPGLALPAARAELEHLVRLAEFTAQPPQWAISTIPRTLYAVLADSIALPITRQGGGWIVTTTLVRNSISDRQREIRNARRRRRRISVAARRTR